MKTRCKTCGNSFNADLKQSDYKSVTVFYLECDCGQRYVSSIQDGELKQEIEIVRVRLQEYNKNRNSETWKKYSQQVEKVRSLKKEKDAQYKPLKEEFLNEQF